MRNLAVLAARISGRPILMRQADAHAWAGRLLLHGAAGGDQPRGVAGLRSRARQMREAAPTPAAVAAAQLGCATPLWMGQADDAGFGWVLQGNIAVIAIEGPLLDEGFVSDWSDWMIPGYDTLARTFAEVQSDDRVAGIFCRLNTPGGMASQGLPDLCRQLQSSRASAGGSKPIYAWAESAFSAGYWIFASVDRGFAPEIGGVGSIGAVQLHCDMSGAYAQDGIVMTPVQFGAKKTDGASFKPLSAPAQADWQSEIDFLGNMFVDGVVAGRPNLTRAAVLATQGACYYAGNTDVARSGQALGLVDAVASEQAAFQALKVAVRRRTSVVGSTSAANARRLRPAITSTASTPKAPPAPLKTAAKAASSKLASPKSLRLPSPGEALLAHARLKRSAQQ